MSQAAPGKPPHLPALLSPLWKKSILRFPAHGKCPEEEEQQLWTAGIVAWPGASRALHCSQELPAASASGDLFPHCIKELVDSRNNVDVVDILWREYPGSPVLCFRSAIHPHTAWGSVLLEGRYPLWKAGVTFGKLGCKSTDHLL